jgi:ankyrin repeat protein
MLAATLEQAKELLQCDSYEIKQQFPNLLALIKAKCTREEIPDLLIFIQQLVPYAIKKSNNPEIGKEIYTDIERALEKMMMKPDNNVLRYCLIEGKYYHQEIKCYKDAMRYYSRVRWLIERGSNAPDQQEISQANTELQQQFDDLETILICDFISPIKSYQEKLTPSPTTALESLSKFSKSIDLIAGIVNDRLKLRPEAYHKRLYSHLMPDFKACLEQARLRLETLRQSKSSESEFNAHVQLLETIAMKFENYDQYDEALECYNLLIEQNSGRKRIAFPFVVDPYHADHNVITAKKLEKLKKKDAPSIDGQFSWQSYRRELCELRKIFKKNKEEVDNREMQRSFTKRCKELIKKLWEDCVSLLGKPPCPFCIMGLGSISRNDLAPYSDLDFAFLIEQGDYKGHEYFQRLVKLFALKVTLTGELDPPGFIIDANEYKSFQRPAQDRNSIDTPSGYLKRFLPGGGEEGTESRDIPAYALHRPVLLYATKSGEQLFEKYMQELQGAWHEQISVLTPKKSRIEDDAKTLSYAYQQEAQLWQTRHNHEYEKQIQAFDSPYTSKINIKERYLAPLTFWISDMALYHGIFDLDTLQQLELLEGKLANKSLIDKMKKALNTLHCLRIKIQQICQQQQDFVYKPESISNSERVFMRGLHLESLFQLTKEEYSSLQEIDKIVLQPAFAMTGVERAQIESLEKSINSNDGLFQAIKSGEEFIPIDSLEKVDLNLRDSEGLAALHLALNHTNEMFREKIVQKLISYKADVNIKTTKTKGEVKEGQTPLHIAASQGFKSIVQLLLKHQADMQQKDSWGRTPLHYAAENDRYTVVEVLLEHIRVTEQPSLINAEDNYKNTPLHCSLRNNSRGETARLLLERGADKKTLNTKNYAPIHVAAAFHKFAIVEWLLNDGDIEVNAQDIEGKTPLHWSIQKNNESVVEQFLNAGADVNIVDDEGKSSLHYATNQGNEQIVRWLLENDADPTIEDKEGQNPLTLAKKAKHPQIADLMQRAWEEKTHSQRPAAETSGKFNLWPRKRSSSTNETLFSRNPKNDNMITMLRSEVETADLEQCDKNGDTLLHRVIQRYIDRCKADEFYDKRTLQQREKETLGLVNRLLQRGANVHAKNANQETPLHKASRAGSFSIARKVCNKAIIHGCDQKGNTALHLASQGDAFYNRYSKFNETETNEEKQKEILDFLEKNYCRLIALLCQNGANVNQGNHFIETPLHLAIRDSRNTSVVKKLIELGANIKDRDQDHNTVLHLATGGKINTYCLTELLLQKEPDLLNLENKEEGICPLYNVLAKEEYPERSKTLSYLLQRQDISLDIKTKNLQTLLHLAVIKIDHSNVKQLLERGCDVNAQDNDGNTPLHWAVKRYKEYSQQSGMNEKKKYLLEISKQLMDHNANAKVTNVKNETPVQLAQDNKELKAILLESKETRASISQSGGQRQNLSLLLRSFSVRHQSRETTSSSNNNNVLEPRTPFR